MPQNNSKRTFSGVEDIYAPVEPKEEESEELRVPKSPRQQVPLPPRESPDRPASQPPNRRSFVLIVGIVIVIVGLVGVGVWLWRGGVIQLTGNHNSGTNQPVTNENPTVNGNSNRSLTNNETNTTVSQPVKLNININAVDDQDHDGLTDAEEKTLGTNPKDADTDHDGLSDFAEVKLYHTDPLNPDTDHDGFSDGDEVKSGHNPNGVGPLQDLINSFNK